MRSDSEKKRSKKKKHKKHKSKSASKDRSQAVKIVRVDPLKVSPAKPVRNLKKKKSVSPVKGKPIIKAVAFNKASRASPDKQESKTIE